MKTILILFLALAPACFGQNYELQHRPVSEDADSITYDNYLVLKDRPPVRLAPTRKLKRGDTYEPITGLEEGSVKVRAMNNEKFIEVSWSSVSIGSGRFITSGFLLIELIPNDLIVLFRDIRDTAHRSGWADSTYSSLEFGVQESEITIVLSTVNFSGALKKIPSFIYSGKNDNGDDVYFRRYTKIETWSYHLENHHLIFDSAQTVLQLEDSYPRKEMSEALKMNFESNEDSISGTVNVRSYLGPYKFQNAGPYGSGRG